MNEKDLYDTISELLKVTMTIMSRSKELGKENHFHKDEIAFIESCEAMLKEKGIDHESI